MYDLQQTLDAVGVNFTDFCADATGYAAEIRYQKATPYTETKRSKEAVEAFISAAKDYVKVRREEREERNK